jgi:YcxB-like protein
MKFRYMVNLEDYKAARRLYRRRKTLLRFARFFALWCIPPIGLWLIAWSIHTERIRGHEPPIIGAIVFLAVSFFPAFWEYYTTRKSFRLLSSKMGGGVTIEIDKNGMIAAWDGKKEQTLSWDRIVNFDSDDRIALFYMQKGSFFFPMRVFDPTQRVELNDLIARHVVKR